MKARLFSAFCVAACSLDQSGLEPSSNDASVAPDANVLIDAALLPDVMTIADASNDVATIDVVVPLETSTTCTPTSCVGERCLGTACAYYASCNDMHTMDSTLKTGVHTFLSANNKNFTAWCDMDTDNGGWTLVARSTPLPSNSTQFGWHQATGSDPTDLSTAYSLDATFLSTFTLALVGSLGGTNTWGTQIFEVALPSGFPGSFSSSSVQAVVNKQVASVIDCSSMLPTMFTNVGYTNHNNNFFFRDNGTESTYGLNTNGWSLAYGDCRAGYMNQSNGMVMVR